MCFESAETLEAWLDLRKEKRKLEAELKDLEKELDRSKNENAVLHLKTRIERITEELADGQATGDGF